LQDHKIKARRLLEAIEYGVDLDSDPEVTCDNLASLRSLARAPRAVLSGFRSLFDGATATRNLEHEVTSGCLQKNELGLAQRARQVALNDIYAYWPIAQVRERGEMRKTRSIFIAPSEIAPLHP